MSAKSDEKASSEEPSINVSFSININGCEREDKKSREEEVEDPVQEAWKELGRLIHQLERKEIAEALSRAIRSHHFRAVQHIVGQDCKVQLFFFTRECHCARVCCTFGKLRNIRITFDICVKRFAPNPWHYNRYAR